MDKDEIDAQTHELRLRRARQIAEDDLRRRIIEASPEIRHDVNVMADILRELVKTERQKAGLDRQTGTLELHINQQQTSSEQPDVTGHANVAGRPYDAAGWFTKDKSKLRVSLIQPRKKYGKLR